MIDRVHRSDYNIDNINDDFNITKYNKTTISQIMQNIDTVNEHAPNLITDEEEESAIV